VSDNLGKVTKRSRPEVSLGELLDAHRDHDTRTRWERLRRRDQAWVILVMALAGLAYAVAFGLL